VTGTGTNEIGARFVVGILMTDVFIAVFKSRSGGKHIYHTDSECSYLPARMRTVELESLHDQYVECEWCAGTVKPSDGGDKSLVEKLDELSVDEVL
jgi:hypothetical protein